MGKWYKYMEIIRYVLYATFIVIIVNRYYDNLGNLILFLSLFLFALTNDILRYKGKIKAEINYYLSIVISIIIGGILEFCVDGYLEVYLFVIMAEIPWLINKKAIKVLYTLNVFTILFVALYRSSVREGIGILDIIREDFMGLVFSLLMISFFSISIFSYVALLIERNKVLKLNKEIEKLTITRERNRIAQEIHDNLGHSLVALSMNLDVARNILDKDMDKGKELIQKCQKLTKDSMNSLRRAVYTLKEENLSQGLKNAIQDLIHNINNTSNITIIYRGDEKVEDIPLKHKSILYTTIREGLTNSIKHSKCSQININIGVSDKIHLSIKDNGLGCKSIIKGNGLKGIEERVNKVNGHIDYKTKEGQGFEISVKLPLES